MFGLTTLMTDERPKVIGILKVMGAGIYHITTLISGDFLKLVLFSFALAMPVVYYFTDIWLQDFSYYIEMSWWVFFLVGVVALFISLLTVSYQFIKDAIANPVKSLKADR